jgi:TatD DNase family protein
MIDSHVHLDADQYPDPSGAIKRALEAGVTAMIAPGTGGESNRRVLELARRFPRIVYAACGYHPERLELSDADLDDAIAIIREQRSSLCAVGEVGMPWYGDRARAPATIARAKQVLARFAHAAIEADLPMIIHAPHDSAREALEILKVAGVRCAVFHWHKSDDATTQSILEAGYFISLTPEVAYRERDQRLVKTVPLGRLLLETDGPWQHDGPFKGRLTEPVMIVEAVDALANLLQTGRDLVGAVVAGNTRKLFRLPF